MANGRRVFKYLFNRSKWSSFYRGLAYSSVALTAGNLIYTSLGYSYSIPKMIDINKIVLADVEDTTDTPNYLYAERVPYLVIGGGPSGYSAAINIVNNDPNAKVLVISTEKYLPYMRPILTKDIWFNDAIEYDAIAASNDPSIFVNKEGIVPVEQLFDPNLDFSPIAFLLNSKATHLNTNTREVTLIDGKIVKFNKIVIATGSEPVYQELFRPLFDSDQPNSHLNELLINYNTIDDFVKLHKKVVEGNKTIVVLDGGACGAELCASLTSSRYKEYNNDVKMVFPESNILSSILPEYLAEKTTEKYIKNGVDVIPLSRVVAAEIKDDKILITLTNTLQIEADIVVDCSQYDTSLYLADGFSCSGAACPKVSYDQNSKPNGYHANAMLQTGGKDIYVCGSAATVFNPTHECSYNRISHFVHAIDSAEAVAKNITSNKPVAYNGFPIYWVDLIDDDTLDVIGLVDSSLPTCSVWRQKSPDSHTQNDQSSTTTEMTQGVVFYYKNDIVVGIVTVNLNHPIGLADKIVRGQMEGEDPKELAKYFFDE